MPEVSAEPAALGNDTLAAVAMRPPLASVSVEDVASVIATPPVTRNELIVCVGMPDRAVASVRFIDAVFPAFEIVPVE